jgi:hypothetical protein
MLGYQVLIMLANSISPQMGDAVRQHWGLYHDDEALCLLLAKQIEADKNENRRLREELKKMTKLAYPQLHCL